MVSVTRHAKLRWLQRSDNWQLSPEQAFRDATEATLDFVDGQSYFHEPSNTYLVVRDGLLTTVLDADLVDKGSTPQEAHP